MIVRPYGGPPSPVYYGAQERGGDPILDAPRENADGGTVYFSPRKAGRCLDQLRLVSFSALSGVYRIDGHKLPGEQTLTVGEAIAGFVAAQIERWQDPRWTFSPKLSGLAGGDGDWAKEVLAFGFRVENGYWGAYRVWSRAWLAMK